jgi:hypothetical protein
MAARDSPRANSPEFTAESDRRRREAAVPRQPNLTERQAPSSGLPLTLRL